MTEKSPMNIFKRHIVNYILIFSLISSTLFLSMPLFLIVGMVGMNYANESMSEVVLPDLGTIEGDLKIIVDSAVSKLGHEYVWGATGPDQFDCSGLMQWAYAQAGIAIGRTTWEQVKEGNATDLDSLQTGDLIFFHTMEGEPPTHVAMYLGNDIFIHAGSEETGVLYSSIKDQFWQDVYYASRHIIENKEESEELSE